MSRERARRREERERVAAVERDRRAREQHRRQRSQRRRDALRSAVPDRPRGRPGLLAARSRRRMAWVAGSVVVVQLVAWPLLPSWTARLVLLAVCLMIVPVAWVLVFGRVG